MISYTQLHNKQEISMKEEKMRHHAENDKAVGHHLAMANYEKAAFLEKLEKDEIARKNNKYKRDLECLIADRAE